MVTAREGGGGEQREIIPEGQYTAVCYSLFDLGMQPNSYMGVRTKDVRKIMLTWELPEVRIDVERDGKTVSMPRVVSNKYTLSLDAKAHLSKLLIAWRGKAFTEEEKKGFEVKAVLGKACLMQIIHNTSKTNGNTYANVGPVMMLPKGTQSPEAENPLLYYSFDEDMDIPDGTPKFIEDMIRASSSWVGDEKVVEQIPEDDIPF